MSHPFQGGVGDRDVSSKGGVSQGRGAPPITTKGRGITVPTLNQPYTDVDSLKSVKPPIRHDLILK